MSAVALVALLAACGDDAPGGGNREMVTVTSTDGAATVTIPPGALPADVSPGDIAITPRTDLAVDDVTIVAAYDLEPHGVVFAMPVQLRFTIPDGSAPRTFSHLHREGVDVLEPRVVSADTAAGTLDVEVDLAHFSRVEVTEDGVFHVEGTPPLTAPVGEPISASFRVDILRRSGTAPEEAAFDGTIVTSSWAEIDRGWDLQGAAFCVDEREGRRLCDLFDRDFLPFAPLGSSATRTGPWDRLGVGVLTCTSAGVTRLSWSVKMTYRRTTAVDWRGMHSETSVPFSATADFPGPFTCTEATADETGTFVVSISDETPGFTDPAIDIESHAAREDDLTRDDADVLKNTSVFECGDDGAVSGVRVVCPEPTVPLAEGGLLVATMNLVGDVPAANPDRSFIYSLVLDSDGDPANDWIPVPPFDWDLFQGADRWYQLIWDHRSARWSLTVTQVAADQTTSSVVSGAWAVVHGRHVNFYVPGSEYTRGSASYRLTAFGHDGMFTAGDRGADVTGADPTAALTPI